MTYVDAAATVPVNFMLDHAPAFACLLKYQFPASRLIGDAVALYNSTYRAFALSLGSVTSEMIKSPAPPVPPKVSLLLTSSR